MGGDRVGSIVYDARIDTSSMRGDAAKAEGIARNTGDGIGRSLSVVKGAALAAVAAITAVTIGFGFTAIKSASELQGMRASFESMTGSAENARQVLSALNKFSFETAFSTDEINKAAQLLLGAGLEVKNLGNYMKNIGDIAGATGADLGMLTLPLSQALARGKLQTQDYYQILNSGAGKLGQVLREELAERGMGDFQKAMEDGKVTSDILFAAIEKSAQRGGFAFEGAIKQSRTFEGRLSNMQESLLNVALAVMGVNRATGEVDPNGAFARLSDGIKFIGDWVTANKEQITGFFRTIGEGLAMFGAAWNEVMKTMQPVFEYIRGNKELWEVLKMSLIAIAAIIGILIITAGVLLVGAFAAVGFIIENVTKTVGALMQGVLWLVGVFSDAINSVMEFGRHIGIAIGNAPWRPRPGPGRIGRALGNMGMLLYDAGKAVLEGLGRGMSDTINNVIGIARDVAGSVAAEIRKVLGIRSPSRVMMQIGDYLMQGFAMGIDRNAGLAIGAAGNASSGVLGAFGGGVLSPTISADYRPYSGSGAAGGAGITQINNINRDIDLDAASRQLAYQVARG